VFERIYEDIMLSWKKKGNRQPLLVEGARQVGKSFLIERLFAPKHFSKTLKLDFMQTPELSAIFDDGLSPSSIIRNAEIATGQAFNPDTDLLYFEEVGMCKQALESLKYFSQDAPNIFLIATGSNIGLFGRFPVGKTLRITIYPLTFQEFLLACDENILAKLLNEHPSGIPKIAHDKLMKALNDYLFVGGMPDAIKEWTAGIKSNQSILTTLQNVRDTQNQLIKDYINDFSKFSEGEKMSALMVERIYKNIPVQLAQTQNEKPIPKFQFKQVNPNRNMSYADVSSPISFLEKLNLVQRIGLIDTADSKFPLASYKQESLFKLTLTDIGLLNAMADIQYKQIINKDFAFKGFIAEVFVLNEIISAHIRPSNAAFYAYKKGESEVEFLFQGANGYPIPLEVKSGKNTKAKSLTALVKRFDLPKAYKLSAKLVEVNSERVVEQWPIYLARTLYNTKVINH
jgi:predicted AAA+ superfamily ATPase